MAMAEIIEVEKKRLLTNAVFSVLQVIVSGIVLLILYGYLLRNLGPEALGMWTLLMAATSLATISNLGLAGSLVSFVSEYLAKGEYKNAAYAIETTIISVAVVMGFVSACLWPILHILLDLIIPAESLAEAKSLLPYVIVVFWFGAMGGVVHSALDGCHRADLRSISTIVCQPIMLIGTQWLSPSLGLIGLAYAQIIQYALWILIGWFFLHGQIKALPLIPFHWEKVQFKKMWRIGVNFQLVGIMVMLSEPLAKGLLSYYSNLSSVAYFEMANRLILQVRAILTSANQVITPYISKLHATQSNKIVPIYLENLRWISMMASIIFSIVIAAGPLVSLIWLGKLEYQFLIFLIMLSIGSFINTLAIPAYYSNIGLNNLMPNVWGHFATMLAMSFTAILLGSWIKPYGSAMAWPIGMMAGSYVTNFGLIKKISINRKSWINQIELSKVVLIFSFGLALNGLNFISIGESNSIFTSVGLLTLFSLVCAHFVKSQIGKKINFKK